MHTEMRLPDGQTEDSPPPARIREVIEGFGPASWQAGSGEVTIRLNADGRISGLSLIRKDPYGFFLYFGEMDSTETIVAVSPGKPTEKTDVIIEGEPLTIPTTFFVSMQQAVEIALYFAQTGKLLESVKWDNLADQD